MMYLLVHNEGRNADGTCDYEWVVTINYKVVGMGRVNGFKRGRANWRELLAAIAENALSANAERGAAGESSPSRDRETMFHGTIEDGFGSTWSAVCEHCGGKMQIVRPGTARCGSCGK